jgi:hypothetical protein
VKEKSLETIRMARALAERGAGRESDFAFEFESRHLWQKGPRAFLKA